MLRLTESLVNAALFFDSASCCLLLLLFFHCLKVRWVSNSSENLLLEHYEVIKLTDMSFEQHNAQSQCVLGYV